MIERQSGETIGKHLNIRYVRIPPNILVVPRDYLTPEIQLSDPYLALLPPDTRMVRLFGLEVKDPCINRVGITSSGVTDSDVYTEFAQNCFILILHALDSTSRSMLIHIEPRMLLDITNLKRVQNTFAPFFRERKNKREAIIVGSVYPREDEDFWRDLGGSNQIVYADCVHTINELISPFLSEPVLFLPPKRQDGTMTHAYLSPRYNSLTVVETVTEINTFNTRERFYAHEFESIRQSWG